MQTYTTNDGTQWPVSDAWPINHPSSNIRINAEQTLNRIISYLNGRSLASVFGSGSTLDQVHGNEWRPDTCTCVLSVIINHYNPGAGTIPHVYTPCVYHTQYTSSVSHYAAILNECQTKERARALLANYLGVSSSLIQWGFDANRHVQLSYASLSGSIAMATAQSVIQAQFPSVTVITPTGSVVSNPTGSVTGSVGV